MADPNRPHLHPRTMEVHRLTPYGCTWFDEAGQPYAVVPAASYDHCLVVRLAPDSGQQPATAPVRAWPEGISPVHHPDGWVGLSEGEGQEAAKAWWVRSAAEPSGQLIEVLDGGWSDWILVDVDPSGSKIITTPHQGGPILVRSFPSLEIVRSVAPPPGEYWDFKAFFAGNMIVSALKGQEERFVAIAPHGKIADLDQSEAIHLAKWPCGKSRSHKSHSETAGILAPEQPLPAAIS